MCFLCFCHFCYPAFSCAALCIGACACWLSAMIITYCTVLYVLVTPHHTDMTHWVSLEVACIVVTSQPKFCWTNNDSFTLVVRDKVGRPPGELGVSKSMEYDIFPFSALTLLVGWQEGHPACINWMLICWWWWFDWSFARFVAPIVQLSPPPPSSFASINTDCPRFTWKMAIKTERENV